MADFLSISAANSSRHVNVVLLLITPAGGPLLIPGMELAGTAQVRGRAGRTTGACGDAGRDGDAGVCGDAGRDGDEEGCGVDCGEELAEEDAVLSVLCV